MVKKQKRIWYSYFSRSFNTVEVILKGTTEETKRTGEQTKRL